MDQNIPKIKTNKSFPTHSFTQKRRQTTPPIANYAHIAFFTSNAGSSLNFDEILTSHGDFAWVIALIFNNLSRATTFHLGIVPFLNFFH